MVEQAIPQSIQFITMLAIIHAYKGFVSSQNYMIFGVFFGKDNCLLLEMFIFLKMF